MTSEQEEEKKYAPVTQKDGFTPRVPKTNKLSSKYSKISTNEHGQATEIEFWKCQCSAIQIRTFHVTWITFFICFFVWFSPVNIYNEISSEISSLTLTEHALAGALSVTSTIIFRLIISDLAKRLGSKIAYVVTLIVTGISLIALGLIQSSIGYIIVHIFLGMSGASFVVTQYHTTRMFDGPIIGSAQAISAGLGNFGGGCAQFIMPLLVYNSYISWRIWMIILATILFIFCFIYYFLTEDAPTLDENEDDIAGSQQLIEYNHDNHLQNNQPPDKTVGSFRDAVSDYRSWILFISYAGCFGVEITFYLMAPSYFQVEYNLNEILSGLIVMIWSSMNLFSRPFGGWLSDRYNLRKRVQLLSFILLLESIFIIIFGAIGHLSLWLAIILSILFSICIQIAEGITFSIVPFIQPKSSGNVIGIVGSGGNFGSMFFVFVILIPWNNTKYDEQYGWIILGSVIMIISVINLLIKFTDREVHNLDQGIKPHYDLEDVKTKQTIKIKKNIV